MPPKKASVKDTLSGCGCLLILAASGISYWILGKEIASLVFCAGVVAFLCIGSFFATILSEDPNVRLGSGCFSLLLLAIGGFGLHHYLPEKMWMFYAFCGGYFVFVLLGISYRQNRFVRGMAAAQHFKQELEQQGGCDLNNLDE